MKIRQSGRQSFTVLRRSLINFRVFPDFKETARSICEGAKVQWEKIQVIRPDGIAGANSVHSISILVAAAWAI